MYRKLSRMLQGLFGDRRSLPDEWRKTCGTFAPKTSHGMRQYLQYQR